MGESADVKGFWLAEAVWVTHACGVGKAMAEWLVDGGSPTDLHECDVNRFEAHQLAPSYIHDRGVQNYIEVYDIIHPLQPMEDPRPLRTSPFYEREQELGAFFLEGNGWERPHWYGVNEGLLGRYEIPRRNAWAERYWHPIAGAEALRHARDGRSLRHDLAQAPGGHRAGRAGLPRRAHDQPPGPGGRHGRVLADARRARRHPQRPDDRAARSRTASRSGRTGISTSTCSGVSHRRTGASRSATSRRAPAASACGDRGPATSSPR